MDTPRTNVVEHEGYRYLLFPDHLDWLFQPVDRPIPAHLRPIQRGVDYDFSRNEFDFLLLCVTARCNIVCDYCFRGFDMKEKEEVDFATFRAIADHFLARAKYKPTFQFTGGEVFVKHDIESWFDYIHERGFRIWMTTNGVSPLIHESATLRRIFGNNPRVEVRVSCDGHEASLYERHRGKPGTFKRVEDNLRYLVSIGQAPSIKTVVTPENFPVLEEILDWAYDLGLSGWNYNVLRYTGAMAAVPPPGATAIRKKYVPYVGYFEIGRKLVEILRRKPHLGRLLGISRFGKIIDTLYGTHPHGVRMMYYTLHYDGRVYTNDNLFAPELAVGNVHTDGVAAFRGLEERRVDLDLDLPACQRCPIHRFCFQKGDFGELYAKDRSLRTEEFPNCHDIRRHFFDMMALREEGARIAALLRPRELEVG